MALAPLTFDLRMQRVHTRKISTETLFSFLFSALRRAPRSARKYLWTPILKHVCENQGLG